MEDRRPQPGDPGYEHVKGQMSLEDVLAEMGAEQDLPQRQEQTKPTNKPLSVAEVVRRRLKGVL